MRTGTEPYLNDGSDQSIRCSSEERLGPLLLTKCTAQATIFIAFTFYFNVMFLKYEWDI